MDFRVYVFNIQRLLLLSLFPSTCFSRDSIEQGFPLMDGETLVSAGDGTFELGFFTPNGNLAGKRYVGIWYRSSPQTVVWVANRDKPVPSSGHGVFRIINSNLQVWDENEEESLWLSSGNQTPQDVLTAKLMDSGNLVLGNSLWESFENATDTFLPGMMMQTGLKLTSWKAKDDPSFGSFTFKLDDKKRYVIMKGSLPYWKLGGKLTMPDMLTTMLSNISLTERPSKGFIYKLPKSREYNGTRLVMKSDGTIEYLRKSETEFIRIWIAPADRCSVVDACGVFGVCNVRGTNMCKCLSGFTLGYKNDFSDGCHRKEGNCGEKFSKLTLMNVKNPEYGESQVSNEMDCMKKCLETCKCNAYSFRPGTYRLLNNTCLIWAEPLYDLQEDYRGGFTLYVRQASEDSDSLKKNCDSCGTILIPYPLSTKPECGDPMYFSFQCNSSDESVTFKALDGDYKVVSLDQSTRKFVVQVNSQSYNCKSKGFRSEVLQLNQSSPFTVTNWCKGSSFQKLSPKAREVEIQWDLQPERVCSSDSDCVTNANCGPAKSDSRNRCLCKTGYKWDGLRLLCIHSQGSSFLLVIVLTSISALALICASTWLIIWRKKMKKQEKKRSDQRSKDLLKLDTQKQIKHYMNPGEFEEGDGEGIDVPFFDFDSIFAATDGFSDYNKLGQGGYGPVYKGTFQGGHEIAVKRLSSVSVQGLEEFKNEVVLIAKLQHRNLVRLRGYCVKGSEKILLYEYMPNNSLDSFIFDEEQSKMLDWEKRFNIIVGIARGLLYLHQDSRLRIIHRDLKTSNVLLDREMEPKISDFGLARIFGGKQTEANTERVVGTYGYMSPEYALEGLFSVKSDVFSFGVVLLEIISGKRNTRLVQLSGRPLSLLGYAWLLWTEKRELELVDHAMTESCNSEQFMKCVKIALICVQEDPSERPTMSTVVTMLDSDSANVPDPLQPAFALKTGTTIASSSSADTRGEITVTLEQGR